MKTKPIKAWCCVGCNQQNRTWYASDEGWQNMCVNPQCGAFGKVLLGGGPPITDLNLTVTWEASNDE